MKMKLRYFGNSACPRDTEKWARYQTHLFSTIDNGLKTIQQENERRLKHIRTRFIGRPHATETYTVEQLEQMGLVGEYSHTVDEYAENNPECVVEYDGPLFEWCDATMTWINTATDDSFATTCSDCSGSGEYIGLSRVESCQACGGKGKV